MLTVFVASSSAFLAASSGFDIIESVIIGLIVAAFYSK